MSIMSVSDVTSTKTGTITLDQLGANQVAKEQESNATVVRQVVKKGIRKLDQYDVYSIMQFAENPAIAVVNKDLNNVYRHPPKEKPVPKEKPSLLAKICNCVADAFKAIGNFFKAVANYICCRGTRPLKFEECDQPIVLKIKKMSNVKTLEQTSVDGDSDKQAV